MMDVKFPGKSYNAELSTKSVEGFGEDGENLGRLKKDLCIGKL